MGFRVAYGNTRSENGWRMCDIQECDRLPIPGSGLVLPFRKGDASVLMRGWLSWFNANVESLNNPGRGFSDEGSWTPVNDVGNSNHLSGTAADLNWSEHAFRVSYSGFNGGEIAKCREGLKLFKNCIWWGQDWNSPKDAMHFQLNFPEGDQRIIDLARDLRGGYLGIFGEGGPVVIPPVIPIPIGSNDRLEYGSRGPAVATLQNGMNRVFPRYAACPLEVDGDFGPKTQAAVREFQYRSNLEVSGIVGPLTKKELLKYGIRI
jgi:Putative peptidoglycan binding domain/D-alanyl-D-alanine carboxypeptidase